MKLRSLLLGTTVGTVAIGIAATWVAVIAVREENRTGAVLSQAQEASHEVSNLLVLTQEYARHAEPRAAAQWHERHATIARVLGGAARTQDEDAGLSALRNVSQSLPELFEALERIPRDDQPFNLRRKEALMDQLLISTQAMSDYAYQWFQTANTARSASDTKLQYVALTTLATLLLILVSLALLVHRRILRPLRRLDSATAAVGRGDMTQRVASQASDELGDLSRRFDSMTEALEHNRQQLQESAKRLRLITDNMPSLIAYIDRGQRYQFVNAHLPALLATHSGDLVGQHVRDVLGANYETIRPQLEAALAGEPQHFERVSIVRGKEMCLLTDYIPDVSESGEVLGIFANAKDITELKAIQQALAEGERRLRGITNNIPALVGHFDTEERCLFANDTVLKLHGIDARNLSNYTLRSGLEHDNYVQHVPYVRRVLQGEACGFEGHLRRDGQDIYFQAHLVPDVGAQGEVRGFYLMSFDVTKVRRAEQARKRSEQRLRQITDNLPVLISYMDQQGVVHFANATFRTWLGAEPTAMLGRPLRDIVGADLYEPRRPYVERAMQGERVDYEADITAQGVTRTLATSYLPDIDGDGKVLGIYTLSTDVSALKAYERKLQSLARFDTLTGLPNRLQFNEKMAEALDRAARSKSALALMFLDLDRFKSINDTLGHAVGDAVLCEFARRLQSSARQVDLVARLAGDEFVVLLEGLHHSAEATMVARKIVDAVALPMALHDRTLQVTTSIGIAFQDPAAPATDVAQLLARADAALYAAKAAGRNTFHLA